MFINIALNILFNTKINLDYLHHITKQYVCDVKRVRVRRTLSLASILSSQMIELYLKMAKFNDGTRVYKTTERLYILLVCIHTVVWKRAHAHTQARTHTQTSGSWWACCSVAQPNFH